MVKGLTFLGRSGVKVIKGLRVAYISGIDFDAISDNVSKTTKD